MKIFAQLIRFCAVTAVFLMAGRAALAADAPKKILFFSKSSGYEHDMIKRANGQLSAGEKILQELAKTNNFEITFSKDGSIFTPENIAHYDAFCFYTTGDLTTVGSDRNPPMSKEGKAAFLEAIRNGKGFVGIHAATDCFHGGPPGPLDPYIEMIGGEFVTHGVMACHQIVVDKNFPGMSAVPDNFGPVEEWYTFRNISTNMHALLVQDTDSVRRSPPYNRPNYPSTWAQHYGKGRVFYTSMGHSDSVWRNPVFQSVLAGGLNWAAGNVDADVTPNLDKAAPEANKF